MTTGTVQNKAISTPAVWSYGVGDDDFSIGDSSADFSARFIPVPQHQASRSLSDMIVDDDHTLSKAMDQEKGASQEQHESQELFSMPSAQSTIRRGSSESSPNMGMRRSLESITTNRRRQSTDLNQSVHSFACEEEPQDAIIIVEETDDHLNIELPLESSVGTRERKKSAYSESWNELQLTPKNLLSKLMPHKVKEAQALIAAKKQAPSTPRAELYKMSRSELRSTLRNSFVKLDSFSGDSNHTASTAFLSDSFHCHDQGPTLEDKKKWGVNSLLEDLQEGTKKKKKSKSGSSKRRGKSKTKEEKVSIPKRSSSCPTVAKLEKKNAKKKTKKKASSGTSTVRSKESRKSKRNENGVLVPKRSSSCPSSDKLNKEERKKKKKSSSRKKSGSKTRSKPNSEVRAAGAA